MPIRNASLEKPPSNSQPDFLYMKLNREARRQSKDLFEMALVDGHIDSQRLRLIFDEVTQKKPRHYMQILKAITRLVRMEVAKHHATIESAHPLSESQSQDIENSLKSKFGQITTEFHHNPELIAGLRIQLGSNVWDGSVQSRLEAIKQS